jgi:hypothetical protein
MSIMIPPEFEPMATITVGQDFPRGDEDKLAELGQAWNQTANELNDILGELNPATAATFESLEGAPAEQFGFFVNQLAQTLPVMSESAARLGQSAESVALEIEYAKYMIILQLAWMTAEIAYLSTTLFGSAAIPTVVAAGRSAVRLILRELFVAVISSSVMQGGMDVAVQVIQFLKGDRTHWDLRATLGGLEMGALGGAVGGVLGQGLRFVAPKFTKSVLGSVTTGALTGLGAGELGNLAFNAGQNLGLGAAAGALGGAIGHGHSLHEGQVPQEHIDIPTFETPLLPKDMEHDEPQQEILDLPNAPEPFDASHLPDASKEALVSHLPSVPGEKLPSLRHEVRQRVEELSEIARTAGLPEARWRPLADAAVEAAGSGNWGETAQRQQEFRMAVEHGLLDQRLADFRAHVDGGFSRLGELGVSQDAWHSQVDAVERAQRTGNPVLVDSALKEYTDFVERHLPVETLTRKNAPQSFDRGVEQLRRELTTVSDPGAKEALRKELEWHQQMRQRLDRLAQSDPQSAVMRRRTITQEETAGSAQEAAQARDRLREFQQRRDLRRQADDPPPGAAQTDLERRLEALRQGVAPDMRGQELRQKVDSATTPEERARALRDLAAHNALTPLERRLNNLREGALPVDAHQQELMRNVEKATAPEASQQAARALREYTDGQIAEQQQQITEQSRSLRDARVQVRNEDLLRRIDALHGRTAQDPQEAELRGRVDAARTPQERAQAIHDLGVHQQSILQQRVDSAATPQERGAALDAQARFNNWTPEDRRLAELRAFMKPGGSSLVDGHSADLMRQIENARTPEQSRAAEQGLKAFTDRQIQHQTEALEERLRGNGQSPSAAAAHEELMRRFDELRGGGRHVEPREAELKGRMEAATTPDEARSAEQQLKDYLVRREQQHQVAEQQRLAQVRVHEQEVERFRDQLTRQQRTGDAVTEAAHTQGQLEQGQQRLNAVRTPDENAAALRHELQQQVESPASGSDRRGSGSAGDATGAGAGGRLDRLVREGIAKQAEQGLASRREEQLDLGQELTGHAAFSLDELSGLPNAPIGRPEVLPSGHDSGIGGSEGLPSVPTTRPARWFARSTR